MKSQIVSLAVFLSAVLLAVGDDIPRACPVGTRTSLEICSGVIIGSGSEEHVCGTIAEDMVWSSDTTYIVDCDVGIAPGYTLTIQSGTVVRFNGDYNLNIGGALIADGTAVHPVHFVPHTAGTWGRILFDDPSVDAVSDDDGTYEGGNLLRHVRIEGATQGIACANATPHLEQITLTTGDVNCTMGNAPLWLTDSELGGGIAIELGTDVPVQQTLDTDGTDRRSEIWGWSLTSEMNGSLYRPNAVVAGDYIYAVGTHEYGAGYRDERAVVNLDGSLGAWEILGPSTEIRGSGMVSTAVGQYIYAVGGRAVQRAKINADGSLGPWTPAEYLQTSRANPALVASDGYLYVLGGLGEEVVELRSVERAKINTDGSLSSWELTEPMLTGRVRPAAVATGGYLYVLGGHSSNSPSWGITYASVEKAKINADGSLSPWTSANSMTRGRSCPAAQTVGDYIYAIGGDDNSVEKAMISPDGSIESWQVVPSPNIVRRWCPAAAATESRLYVLGGFDSPSQAQHYRSVELAVIDPLFHPLVHIEQTHSGSLSLPALSQVVTSEVGGDISLGSESSVRSTIATGNVTINGMGLVQNNCMRGVTVGDSSVVVSNTVGASGISAGSDGTVASNTVTNATSWGIQTGSEAIVQDNYILGCTNGIHTGGGLVQSNLVVRASSLGLEIGSASVENNTFTLVGGSAIKITSGTPTLITGNNFELNSGPFEIENRVPRNNLATVDAQLNWWGTTSEPIIRQRIYDFADDYTVGTILYSPVLTQPSSIAPTHSRIYLPLMARSY